MLFWGGFSGTTATPLATFPSLGFGCFLVLDTRAAPTHPPTPTAFMLLAQNEILQRQLATSADTESEVRSEAFWVVLNAASCGSDAQVGGGKTRTYLP